MKLLFKKTKEQRIDADFKGSPIEAVEVIIHVMEQYDVIAKIITTAAIAFQELKGSLDEDIESVKITKKRLTKK